MPWCSKLLRAIFKATETLGGTPVILWVRHHGIMKSLAHRRYKKRLNTKDFFVFCSGKIWLVLFQGCCSFVLRHLCPVHKINAQTPITTHLLHEFLVNVKQRMAWSYTSAGRQYPADGTCLTSVNMQKYVTSLWLLWKSPIFPDLYKNTWLGKLSFTGKRIIKFSWHCNRCHTLILWGDPIYRCSFRINRI